ncbi:MAG: TIGR04076 family protein [Asgard group archaeon]|nr:TIGR04076 family protein [Asgard group archaeon]
MKVFGPKEIIGKDFILLSGKPIQKCGFFDEGDKFIVPKTGIMSEGFCQHAYYAIYRSLDFIRLSGGYKDWTGEDVIYSACSDGIRPVCFKLERI